VGLGAEPTFNCTPMSGRENQFAEAGESMTADSNSSVVTVIFSSFSPREFDLFQTAPQQGDRSTPCRATRRKRAKQVRVPPEGNGVGLKIAWRRERIARSRIGRG